MEAWKEMRALWTDVVVFLGLYIFHWDICIDKIISAVSLCFHSCFHPVNKGPILCNWRAQCILDNLLIFVQFIFDNVFLHLSMWYFTHASFDFLLALPNRCTVRICFLQWCKAAKWLRRQEEYQGGKNYVQGGKNNPKVDISSSFAIRSQVTCFFCFSIAGIYPRESSKGGA